MGQDLDVGAVKIVLLSQGGAEFEIGCNLFVRRFGPRSVRRSTVVGLRAEIGETNQVQVSGDVDAQHPVVGIQKLAVDIGGSLPDIFRLAVDQLGGWRSAAGHAKGPFPNEAFSPLHTVSSIERGPAVSGAKPSAGERSAAKEQGRKPAVFHGTVPVVRTDARRCQRPRPPLGSGVFQGSDSSPRRRSEPRRCCGEGASLAPPLAKAFHDAPATVVVALYLCGSHLGHGCCHDSERGGKANKTQK
ncbi:unnamed protein product [Pseudo-nitzschia multistriata]|uniref:Uncharacterized protein n=1 Tax=Pseudo-nitzschia multistriata TaxID=183589 RepID=A0A448Z8G0_9STRA|nr:unnamed protein product [Pseudo-nitzschia multistriata]